MTPTDLPNAPDIDPNSPENQAKWQKIAKATAEAQQKLDGKKDGIVAEASRDSNIAWRVMADIISAPAMGLLIGFALDRWLGTKPLFILVCFFIGLGAGFLNAYRTGMGYGSAIGFKKKK